MKTTMRLLAAIPLAIAFFVGSVLAVPPQGDQCYPCSYFSYPGVSAPDYLIIEDGNCIGCFSSNPQ